MLTQTQRQALADIRDLAKRMRDMPRPAPTFAEMLETRADAIERGDKETEIIQYPSPFAPDLAAPTHAQL